MNEIQFGIRVGYDGKPVADGARRAEEDLKRIGEAGARAGADAARGFDRMAVSAKQTAFAMRQVPMQFTDIVTQLASGQNPFQVLIQQGGQLKDAFGGVAPAARAMGGYIASLVTPFSVTAAAIGGFALAYFQGAREQDAFRRGLILTGNAAGTTAEQMADAARRVSRVTGGSQGAAAEALTLAVGSGIPGASLMAVADAAVRMQQVTGRAIDDTVSEFAKLAREPAAASKKLDQELNYLTASTYRQIRALEDQGRTAEAGALAMQSYATAVASRTDEIVRNLGVVEGKWLTLKALWGDAKDWVLDVGRPGDQLDVAADKVMKLRANVRALESSDTVPAEALARRREMLAAAEAEMVAVRNRVAADNAAAAAKAQANAQEKAGIALSQEAEKFADKATQKRTELARVEALYAASPKGAADTAARKAAIAGINERFKGDRKADNGLDDAAREQAKSYAQQYEAAAKLARGLEAEAAAGEKLLPVERAIAEARATLSDAQAREVEQALAGALLIERRTAAEKSATEQSRAWGAALKEQVGPIEERTRALAQELENAGRTEAEINAVAIARLEEARATAAGNGAHQEHLDYLDTVIDRLRGLGVELDRQAAAQSDWVAGARRGLGEYSRDASNAAANMGNAFKRGAQMAEDAIASFVVKGKLDIRSLAEFVAMEMAREQIARPLVQGGSSWLSGLLRGGSANAASPSEIDAANLLGVGLPTFAGGGDHRGGWRVVGERGPELEATGPARIFTADETRGILGGGGNVKIEVVNQGTPQRVVSSQASFDAQGAVVRLFLADLRDNGPMRQAMVGSFGLRG